MTRFGSQRHSNKKKLKGKHNLGEMFAIDYDNEADLNVIDNEGVDWIKLAQDMLQWLAIVCTVIYPLCFVWDVEILGQILKWDSAVY
jgi:hypothetical protein